MYYSSLVDLVARWLVGAVFVASGISKTLDRKGFLDSVLDFQILPPLLARPFARALPLVEFVCGLFLVFGILASQAACLAAVMLAIFVIAVSVNLLRGRSLACHCFGKWHAERIGLRTIIRNIGLALLSAYTATFPSDFALLSADAFLHDPSPPSLDALPAFLIAASVATMVLTTQQASRVLRSSQRKRR